MVSNTMFNIRVFGKFRICVLFTRLQTLEGMTTKVIGEKDKHYIFWDFDNIDWITLLVTLRELQRKYNLADIFIFSDKPKSYRAFCFSKRTLKQYLAILLETKGIEWGFITWTFKRQKGTLRISPKANREPNKCVAVLNGFEHYTIPDNAYGAIYETGLDKIRIVKLGK